MSKLTMLGATLALAAGCYRGDTGTKTPVTTTTTPPPTDGKPAAFSASSVIFGDKSAGLLEANMTATVEALTPKMPGYRIEMKDDAAFTGFSAFSASPHLNVYVGDERVFAVVIHGTEIFNVHTDNKHVGVQSHPTWHVGSVFQDSRTLSRCDCWGDKVVCWKDGEHTALAFDRGCDNLANLGNDKNTAALKVLDGLEIKRMVWNPKPFEPDHETPTSAPKGGGLTGTVVPHEHPTQGDEDGDEGGGDDDGD